MKRKSEHVRQRNEDSKILYDWPKLVKIHNCFIYFAFNKPICILKLAQPWEIDAKSKRILEGTQYSGNTFQRIFHASIQSIKAAMS